LFLFFFFGELEIFLVLKSSLSDINISSQFSLGWYFHSSLNPTGSQEPIRIHLCPQGIHYLEEKAEE
jgi:hypothetical protein